MAQDIHRLMQDTQALVEQCARELADAELRHASTNPSDATHARPVKEKPAVTDQNTDKARNKNRAANQAAVELLQQAYPETFNSESPKPLKIGIQEDLVADEKVSRGKIKRALATYVRNPRYLHALVEGAERVDLSGAASGIVSADEEKHAKAKLTEYAERRKERIKEQRKAQRVAEKEQRLSSKLEMLVQKTSRH